MPATCGGARLRVANRCQKIESRVANCQQLHIQLVAVCELRVSVAPDRGVCLGVQSCVAHVYARCTTGRRDERRGNGRTSGERGGRPPMLLASARRHSAPRLFLEHARQAVCVCALATCFLLAPRSSQMSKKL
jgi:hypothetical protein